MHPRDHIKSAYAISEHDQTDTGASRVLHQGVQRSLHTDRLNSDDTPRGGRDSLFLHAALDRHPEEFTYGAPAGDRRHAIDITFPERNNSPAWFHMLGSRSA